MRVLLIGASGQLGTDIRRTWRRHEIMPLDHAALEIEDRVQVQQALHLHRPDLVINTAAFHQVERCEREVERAFLVNAVAVHGLALASAEAGATLVQISTDYVFDGSAGRPYHEDDVPAPLNVYGCSKLAGESLLRAVCPRHYIVRTSGLFGHAGSSGKGLNFVERILQRARAGDPLEVVHDQSLAQTATADLAERLQDLVETDAFGTYHLTNSGGRSWYEFACLCLALAGIEAHVRPISSDRYGAQVRRPPYSVLASSRLAAAGVAPMRPLEFALRDYLAGSV